MIPGWIGMDVGNIGIGYTIIGVPKDTLPVRRDKRALLHQITFMMSPAAAPTISPAAASFRGDIGAGLVCPNPETGIPLVGPTFTVLLAGTCGAIGRSGAALATGEHEGPTATGTCPPCTMLAVGTGR
jgi:hypothetical protein